MEIVACVDLIGDLIVQIIQFTQGNATIKLKDSKLAGQQISLLRLLLL